MFVKVKKNWCALTRIAAVFFIMVGQRIYTFAISFIDDSLSVSISVEIVWIDKLDYFHDRIWFPNIGWHGNKKDSFLVIIATVATRKKILQNLNLIGSNHHCKKWVDRITVGWDKMSQPQKCNFF